MHRIRSCAAARSNPRWRAGEMLDGEGGYCAWGKLVPASRSRALRALPIGLAHGVRLTRPVAHGTIVTRAEVDTLPDNAGVRARQELEATGA
jgi:predicted homoserine dehydrogenase-like protein